MTKIGERTSSLSNSPHTPQTAENKMLGYCITICYLFIFTKSKGLRETDQQKDGFFETSVPKMCYRCGEATCATLTQFSILQMTVKKMKTIHLLVDIFSSRQNI